MEKLTLLARGPVSLTLVRCSVVSVAPLPPVAATAPASGFAGSGSGFGPDRAGPSAAPAAFRAGHRRCCGEPLARWSGY
jgi:hypothetical protein